MALKISALHKSLATIGSAALVLSLAACSGGESTATNGSTSSNSSSTDAQATDLSDLKTVQEIADLVPEAVKADGKLIVGDNISYAPAEFYAADGKTAQGYDIDLAKALAKVMGLEVDIQDADFASIIPAIPGKYELGIASFSITAERLQAVNMIEYFQVGSKWAVATGNPKNFDPANPCGFVVGVQTGTVQDETIDELNAQCPADKQMQIQRMDQFSTVTTSLIGGKIDAFYADSNVSDYAVQLTNNQAETIGDNIDPAGVGIVTAKDDAAMTEATQKALQYLMDNGYLTKIFGTWGITDGINTEAVLNPGA